MKTYRINQVAKMTGLSTENLRVWEKRYRLISPQRGSNRYRLYSEEDVDLLKYLISEINLGQSIGELASLGRDEILNRMRQEKAQAPKAEILEHDPLIGELEKFLLAIDRAAFEKRLNEILALLPFDVVFQRVLVPLQIRIGELWFDEKIGVAVEHYVTTQVKQKLFAAMNMTSSQNGPKIVIACPPWELHEIGAQMVAYHCSTLGCQAILLGANLPLEDLIHFCTNTNPDGLALSFTTPIGENRGKIFFAEIVKNISPLYPVWVGGQGISGMEKYIESKNLKIVKALSDLNLVLDKLITSK
ncbi:MAG: MerR family transcriptional regulator [Nitrospinota bacterium]|jgi:DNA-binding transcriptional MerR regulator|nr:MerR family transcriptional regulator [Nitrospinota bacterium]